MQLLLGFLSVLVIAGCADNSREKTPMRDQIGKNCIVYFRKDALGMAADVPSSVTTGNLNGAEVTQAGELMEAGIDWIVIGYNGRSFHISRDSIQMVEFGKSTSTRSNLSEPFPPQPVKTDPPDGHR